MINRVVEIQTPGVAVNLERGSLKVKAPEQEPVLIPLDAIAVLMVGVGASLSTNAMSALLDRGAAIVLTGDNYMPKAHVWPIEGFHLQRARMLAQIGLSQPFKKNLWKHIVMAKVRGQGEVAHWAGKPDEMFEAFLLKVKSGDTENIEAQAARHYWPLLFGKDFRRNPNIEGINSLLNYGYAILRAACARAVSAAGLHPSYSVFHESKENAYALVDDLMEPFRPLVDALVFQWQTRHGVSLDREAKKHLVSLLNLRVVDAKELERNFSEFLFEYAREIALSMAADKPKTNLTNSLVKDFLKVNGF